jgi:hypothetical protein
VSFSWQISPNVRNLSPFSPQIHCETCKTDAGCVVPQGLNHAIRFTGYQSSRNLVVEGIFAQDGMTMDQNLFRSIWGAVFGAIFSAFMANSN